MDIDDLLAEVSADSIPRETRDLQELTRAWVAERVAPELLPYPGMLMERVLGRIRKQVCTDILGKLCRELGWTCGVLNVLRNCC
jgi:hypothetical protein